MWSSSRVKVLFSTLISFWGILLVSMVGGGGSFCRVKSFSESIP